MANKITDMIKVRGFRINNGAELNLSTDFVVDGIL